MSEMDSQLSTTTRKAAATLEERFSELSKQHCPDREGEFCKVTEKKCELESCQKMNEELESYL